VEMINTQHIRICYEQKSHGKKIIFSNQAQQQLQFQMISKIIIVIVLVTANCCSGLDIGNLRTGQMKEQDVSATQCNPGQVVLLDYTTQTASCTNCPRGSYCVGGASPAVPCIDGTMSLTFNGSDPTACKLSPAGTVSLGTDRISLKCQPGQYCPSGTYSTGLNTYARYIPATTSSAAVLRGAVLQDDPGISCPTGYYCPDPSEDPIPCPCGTYNPDTEMTDPSACGMCPMTTYCTGATSFPSQCNPVCKSSCSWMSCSNCS